MTQALMRAGIASAPAGQIYVGERWVIDRSCGGRGRLKGRAGAFTQRLPFRMESDSLGRVLPGEKRELYRLGRPVSGSRSPDGHIRLPQTHHRGRRSGREWRRVGRAIARRIASIPLGKKLLPPRTRDLKIRAGEPRGLCGTGNLKSRPDAPSFSVAIAQSGGQAPALNVRAGLEIGLDKGG
jgi:hypothetical protein